MLQADTITLLLVSDHAEEVKQATMCLRGFYPGCRVEAVYSAEEGVEWASKQDWHVILLDEQFPNRSGLDLLPEIRRRAPNSAIIVQAELNDPARALQVMRAGADYYLFRPSSTFLTELPIVTREVLEKRELRLRHESLQDRYSGLVEALDDMVYELDDRGRFVSVNDTLLSLLGYSHEEVIGSHYSKLLHPQDFRTAERRLDERRTGTRATRNLSVRLVPKSRAATPQREVEVLINASGLYDRRHRFIGTVGIIRHQNGQSHGSGQLQHREHPASDSSAITHALTRPVRDLLVEAERLLNHIRGLLAEESETLTDTASPSATESRLPGMERSERPSGTPTEPGLGSDGGRQQKGQTQPPTSGAHPAAAQTFSSLERRRWARLDVHLEVNLCQNDLVWKGSARNLSLGGVYIEFEGSIPANEGQPIQCGIVSEVGVLEIKGRVQGIREAPRRTAELSRNPPVGLAIEFSPLGTVEELILASLLDELREGSGTVKITALLTPQETGDLLLEVSSSEKEPAQFTPLHPCPPEAQELLQTERRLTPRINLPIPVRIQGTDPSVSLPPQTAQFVNISTGGACILSSASSELVGSRLTLHVFLPPGVIYHPADSSAEPSECTLTAEVLRAAPDTTDPAAPGRMPAPSSFRYGLRFVHLDDDARRIIARVVAALLASSERVEPEAESTMLVSEPRECTNAKGQRIALYYDHRRGALPPGSPVMIIAPGYGETKKEYITLAYYLAANGFHVIRYDHTNHVGESDGDIERSTLSGMQRDMFALLDYAERTWPVSPVGLIATSLASRVALKAVTGTRRVKLLVLIAGVVDVQATLLAVHQEDLIASYIRGTRRGIINMLGFNIDADAWLADATDAGYADLRATMQDAERISTPIILFTAEHDAWVHLESVKAVHATLPSDVKHLYVIPEALHRLHENPRKARAVFRQLTTCCREQFYPLSPNVEIQEPLQRDIGLQNRLERERARAQHQMAKTEMMEFWRDYLDHFHYIANVSDFWHLLDHIYRLLGDIQEVNRVLDAGCGNGNFGMFLMVNQAYRLRHASAVDPASLSYVGADFVFSALLHARGNLLNVALKSGRPLASALAMPAPVVTSLALSDLNMSLPFRDNQFDRIVCNLVIGYLQDPLFTLRELMRVLSPNGKLVITNLKPNADLSHIYRNFIQVTEHPEEVEEARRLLNNSGKIKQGESDGIFRFFDRHELAMLLESSGAARPRIYTTFANQAYIAVAEKPSPTADHSVPADGIPSEPLAHA